MRDMWTVESSLAGGLELCQIADALDLGVKLEEGRTKGTWDGIGILVEESGPSGPENSQEELGAEEGDAEAVAGDGVSVGVGDTGDQALETKAAQIVGHAAEGVVVPVPAEQVGNVCSEVPVPETVLDVVEDAEGMEECHHARIAEAESRGTLIVLQAGALQPIESVLGQGAVVADPFHLQEPAVDASGDAAQVVQVLDGLGRPEVDRLIDRGFGPQSPPLLEVLLDVGVLECDVETGVHAVGVYPGAVAEVGFRCATAESDGKQQADTTGPSQVDVFADDFLEEVSTLGGPIEDLGQADFHLPEREPMLVTGQTIFGTERPRQALRPAVEEALNVLRTELAADLFQPLRLPAGQETVVQCLESEMLSPQLLLHPFVSVQAELDRVRQVGPDLEEGGPPLEVLDVEVVVLHEDRLAREVEEGHMISTTLAGLERPRPLLRHTDQDDAFATLETHAMSVGDVVLPLATLKMDQGNPIAPCQGFDGLDEAVVERPKQGWGGNRLAQMVVYEMPQLPPSLKGWKVAVHVEPVDTGGRQRHVIANNLVDVGHRRAPCKGNSPMLLRQRSTPAPKESAPTLLQASTPTRRFEAELR